MRGDKLMPCTSRTTTPRSQAKDDAWDCQSSKRLVTQNAGTKHAACVRLATKPHGAMKIRSDSATGNVERPNAIQTNRHWQGACAAPAIAGSTGLQKSIWSASGYSPERVPGGAIPRADSQS